MLLGPRTWAAACSRPRPWWAGTWPCRARWARRCRRALPARLELARAPSAATPTPRRAGRRAWRRRPAANDARCAERASWHASRRLTAPTGKGGAGDDLFRQLGEREVTGRQALSQAVERGNVHVTCGVDGRSAERVAVQLASCAARELGLGSDASR